MKTDLTNRVAIVTGAGTGPGREHALLLPGWGLRSWSTIWAAT